MRENIDRIWYHFFHILGLISVVRGKNIFGVTCENTTLRKEREKIQPPRTVELSAYKFTCTNPRIVSAENNVAAFILQLLITLFP